MAPRTTLDARRGLVLLYAIAVFSTITAIALTLLDSGEYFLGTTTTDAHTAVAQNAALSGLAYGEAMIQRMIEHSLWPSCPTPPDPVFPSPPFQTTPCAPGGNRFPCGTGACNTPMPAWAGRRPSSNIYVELTGSAYDPALTAFVLPNDQRPAGQQAVSYTWTTAVVPGGPPVEKERARFSIELRECAIPNPATAGCRSNLFDLNLFRNGTFFPTGSSVFTPNPQSGSGGAPESRSFLYTMRVEGEALALDSSTTTFVTMARVVVKEPFTIGPSSGPSVRMFPQAFWYHNLNRGY